MKWWTHLAIAAVGVFVLRWAPAWPAAVFAGLAAGVSLLAAGSLRAAGYILKRAAETGSSDEEAAGSTDAPQPPGERTELGAAPAEPLSAHGRGPDKRSARMAVALDLTLCFAGVAVALLAFYKHAAAAGWAGASAGLAASGHVKRWPRLKVAVFALAAAPAVVLALLWVPAPDTLDVARTTAAILVMTGGACTSGASVLAMRWRLSERLSLPPAMALAVWGLTVFFAKGFQIGRPDQATIVACSIGVGGAIALAGYAVGALDGPAAGVVLFLTSRVYSFLDWAASIPFLASTVLGWRPKSARARAPGGRGSGGGPAAGREAGNGVPQQHSAAPGAAPSRARRRGAAYELAVGALPMGLAGGYFAFGHGAFLAAYSAFCAAAAAAGIWEALERRPRARVAAAALTCVLLPLLIWVFGLILGSYESYGIRGAGGASAGALVSWFAGEVLLARSADWKRLPPPVRRAGVGAVAAALAVCVAAVITLGGAEGAG